MQLKSVAAWLCAFTFTVNACGSSTGPENAGQVEVLKSLPRAMSTTEQQGVQAGNNFALRLLRETTSRSGNTKNVLLSPFSVWTALGLTMNGASGNTETEMRNTLGWGTAVRSDINVAYRDLAALLPTLDPQVTFRSANGIWVLQPLTASAGFTSDATNYFSATVGSAATPTAMVDGVNAWANQKTDGMIPKALNPPLPDGIAMLLANALLFKGTWREQFELSNTKNAPFTLESGVQVTTPLMNRTGSMRAVWTPDAQVVELPFGNAAYSMLVLMPTTMTVGNYVATLDSTRLATTLVSLRSETEARLTLPRFRLSATTELSPTLKSMGMPAAFGSVAEFPRLFSTAVSANLAFVQHVVTVDVDEVGARAAAVTVVGVQLTSGPPSIVINKPFVFFIREKFTGALLFAGVVRDPR